MINVKRHSRISNEELLQILREYYEQTGKFPEQQIFNSKNGLPSYSAYVNRFGNFYNAIKLSGLEIPDELKYRLKTSYTDEELLHKLDYFVKEHLKENVYLPVQEDFENNELVPHHSVYHRRFGGLIKAYKRINIDYCEYNSNAYKQELKNNFILLSQLLNRTPNSRDISKYCKRGFCASPSTYIQHFNSIYELQILCNMTPTKMGMNRTQDEMAQDLSILYNELNDIPTASDIDNCDYTCCFPQYVKVFGNLENALLSIGIPKDKINNKIKYTSHGVKCRSQYEYRFATMLEKRKIIFDTNVNYKNHIIDFNHNYSFDFVINLDNKLHFVEIFGIVHNEKYDLKTKYKIDICKQNNIKLIQLYPFDFHAKTQQQLYDYLLEQIESKKEMM